jgi:signal transduction histidine kinase
VVLGALTPTGGRLRRLPPLAVDLGIGALFAGLVAAELVQRPLPSVSANLAAAGLTLLLTACLLLRRRAPLVACVVAVVALTTESVLGVATDLSPLATLVAVYSIGRYASRSRARWGPVLVVVGVVSYFAGTPGLRRADPVEVVSVLLIWLAAWALGYGAARRREEQDRTRRAVERQSIAEERIRMSRELHDLVGHTVNLLVVQAGAARVSLDRDPALARELLRGMEQTGRTTLADLDRVLATLRGDPYDDGPGRDPAVPAPGLTELPDLVGRFHDSGVVARLSLDPTLRLPRDLDLSVYRIVQEALTNTLKHAAPCSAVIAVRRADDAVVIEVSDDGPGRRENGAPPGRGLLGIAERVARCGGVLEYGNGDHGGFRLRAVLPLP